MRDLDSSNFEIELGRSLGVGVFIFSAPWCGPCKAIAPYLEQLDALYKDIDFFKIDIDQNPDLRAAHQVTSVPTFKFSLNGTIIRTQVGIQHPSQLDSQIRTLHDKTLNESR